MHFKNNQKGSDFGLVIRHKANKEHLGILSVQVSGITVSVEYSNLRQRN